MKIYSNIKPYLPKGTGFEISWANEEQLIHEGLSVSIDFSNPLTTGFNEGQTYLLMHYKEFTIPPLWVLAHSYINNEKAKYFLDKNLVTTSSIRVIKDNEFYVFHSPLFNKYGKEYVFSFFHSYPIKIPLKLEDYPKEDLPLEKLISDYSNTAKALFLMDEEQLKELNSKILKIYYDKEKPALQGTSFIDSRGNEGIKPYLFGFRREGSVEEQKEFFGVTTIQYIPITSYPIEFKRKNEIQVTYSSERFYELTKYFEDLKKKFSKRRNIKKALNKLEDALYDPLKNH